MNNSIPRVQPSSHRRVWAAAWPDSPPVPPAFWPWKAAAHTAALHTHAHDNDDNNNNNNDCFYVAIYHYQRMSQTALQSIITPGDQPLPYIKMLSLQTLQRNAFNGL